MLREPGDPVEKAIGMQDRLFELSGNDKALNVLHKLKNDYEAASSTVAKAERKLVELGHARDAAAETLLDFYRLTIESATD